MRTPEPIVRGVPHPAHGAPPACATCGSPWAKPRLVGDDWFRVGYGRRVFCGARCFRHRRKGHADQPRQAPRAVPVQKINYPIWEEAIQGTTHAGS
jgi:hypothetical protein